jgi:hypothetical protein
LTNLIGSISLFLLRKIAFYLLTAGLALSILMSVWHSISKGWLEGLGGPGAIGAFVGFGISAVICAYSWKLCNSGNLN